jgi:hypothetical protein
MDVVNANNDKKFMDLVSSQLKDENLSGLWPFFFPLTESFREANESMSIKTGSGFPYLRALLVIVSFACLNLVDMTKDENVELVPLMESVRTENDPSSNDVLYAMSFMLFGSAQEPVSELWRCVAFSERCTV